MMIIVEIAEPKDSLIVANVTQNEVENTSQVEVLVSVGDKVEKFRKINAYYQQIFNIPPSTDEELACKLYLAKQVMYMNVVMGHLTVGWVHQKFSMFSYSVNESIHAFKKAWEQYLFDSSCLNDLMFGFYQVIVTEQTQRLARAPIEQCIDNVTKSPIKLDEINPISETMQLCAVIADCLQEIEDKILRALCKKFCSRLSTIQYYFLQGMFRRVKSELPLLNHIVADIQFYLVEKNIANLRMTVEIPNEIHPLLMDLFLADNCGNFIHSYCNKGLVDKRMRWKDENDEQVSSNQMDVDSNLERKIINLKRRLMGQKPNSSIFSSNNNNNNSNSNSNNSSIGTEEMITESVTESSLDGEDATLKFRKFNPPSMSPS